MWGYSEGMTTTPGHSGVESATSEARFIGRDPSWLRFNERVLSMATDQSVPLLERVRFISIFVSNLDEFFMKRMALLRRRLEMGLESPSLDGLTTRQQFALLRERVVEQQQTLVHVYDTQIRPALASEGIHIVAYDELDEDERRRVDDWFDASVFPILTPLSVDPGHRFPFISNLSENLGIVLTHPTRNERHFARLKIPDQAPRLVPIGEQIGKVADPRNVRFVPLEGIIRANLRDVFPGMKVEDILSFRVTRGMGMELEDEGFENLLKHVEAELRQRRFADPVRVETPPEPSLEVLALLLDELELNEDDVYPRSGPLEYADLMDLQQLDRPDLKQPRWTPVAPLRLVDDSVDVFGAIRERDILLNHPYDSFTASVERFIEEAAEDPHVLAIKLTLYRTSRDSPFIESLIRAAEAGKAVACLVELRARFDEDRNVSFARLLEDHGVHVAYGVVGLKTHCKCSLVVRREEGALRRYAHIGTGNYHPGTAQLYTDCGLMTCDPDLTADVLDLFNYLTGRSLKSEYRKLLVAPGSLRRGFEEMIDAEMEHARAGRPARIIAKMNAMEDPGIIERLYAASDAGVDITLIVRGFCCLRPGVPGLSENIRVLSIVGRFLEHSRIYHFGDGKDDPVDGRWFVGSADWMSRNLNDRVEAVAPILDEEARRRLHHIVSMQLRDRRRAWEMAPDGTYSRVEPDPGDPDEGPERLGSFEALCREAIARRRKQRAE